MFRSGQRNLTVSAKKHCITKSIIRWKITERDYGFHNVSSSCNRSKISGLISRGKCINTTNRWHFYPLFSSLPHQYIRAKVKQKRRAFWTPYQAFVHKTNDMLEAQVGSGLEKCRRRKQKSHLLRDAWRLMFPSRVRMRLRSCRREIRLIMRQICIMSVSF